jgi:hydrogenase maturation protease
VQAGVLVLGVGNPLRADDGVGQAVVERLGLMLAPDAAELRAVYQLTPELAADIAGARLVVVVDASVAVPPGEVAVRDLAPGSAGGEPFSHSVDPAGLVALARALYGAAPRMVLVGVGPRSLEAGEGLSPAVAGAVGVAADAIAAIIGER